MPNPTSETLAGDGAGRTAQVKVIAEGFHQQPEILSVRAVLNDALLDRSRERYGKPELPNLVDPALSRAPGRLKQTRAALGATETPRRNANSSTRISPKSREVSYRSGCCSVSCKPGVRRPRRAGAGRRRQGDPEAFTCSDQINSLRPWSLTTCPCSQTGAAMSRIDRLGPVTGVICTSSVNPRLWRMAWARSRSSATRECSS